MPVISARSQDKNWIQLKMRKQKGKRRSGLQNVGEWVRAKWFFCAFKLRIL